MTENEIMQIEWACEKLVRQFVNYSDKNDIEKVAALFTEDAIFVRPSAPDQELAGRSAIMAAFASRPEMVAVHMISNHVVEVISASEASGFSYISFQGTKGSGVSGPLEVETQLYGEFLDRYQKTAAGWLIKERRGRVLLKAPA